MGNQELSAIYNQQLEVIRLEKILIDEMSEHSLWYLHDCPSYPEYKKQMDILASLVE